MTQMFALFILSNKENREMRKQEDRMGDMGTVGVAITVLYMRKDAPVVFSLFFHFR